MSDDDIIAQLERQFAGSDPEVALLAEPPRQVRRVAPNSKTMRLLIPIRLAIFTCLTALAMLIAAMVAYDALSMRRYQMRMWLWQLAVVGAVLLAITYLPGLTAKLRSGYTRSGGCLAISRYGSLRYRLRALRDQLRYRGS